ncbi:MAG TPA: bifunctional serine/threonine-protein kinase/formylglycine-generating enzyme family protein [Gemmataceae bacterium]|nr:bifunctional serine/threonine-protein kinase/formylglycine-generating enzyme family protein [Gemmataceae bacterium]
MPAPTGLLSDVGRTVFGALGAGLTGDFVVEVLPQVVNSTWDAWSKDRDEAERRTEIDALVRATDEEVHAAVSGIAKDVALGQPPEVQEALAAYLNQIPPTIRHSLRRPTDPRGARIPADLPLRQAEDLLPFMPIRLPRFKVGDTPLPGVDWQLIELLGVGGFGEVWKARNPNMSSAPPVALKFCLDPPSANVLRNEARLLDRLMQQGRHPGIVTLRQTYLSAEPPCLEYEYIPGGDLAGLMQEWHRQRNGPAATQVTRVMLRLAEIVAFAHRLDPPIVHRDLKPANILVQRTPVGKFVLRIADFGNGGVAASHAIRQTLRGVSQAQLLVSAVRGACTPLYASPQQMRGYDADPRDDIYALGVIWYQLMTGELGTGRPGGTRWPKRLQEQGMAGPFVELLGSCFEDNPDDRPHNAGSLAEELRAMLQGMSSPTSAPIVAPAAETAPAAPAALPRRVSNSLGMTLTLIPSGTFKMGSPSSETDRGHDEGPLHEVTITQPFYMGIYPVTQRQFEAVMGHNPANFNSYKGGGPDFPVERISWNDAMEFCWRLGDLPAEKAAGRSYRLPTEAEWEYACRGGVQMPFPCGVTLSSLDANFNGKYPYGLVLRGSYLERTSKVGSYPSNPFGLFDVHGNVWEWCADYYDRTYYKNSPRSDPPGPAKGNQRVVRGGSCHNIGRICRSAYRFGIMPTTRDIDVGMRVVMTLNRQSPA